MIATRVLVARLDNLGDVLLAGPAVRAVRASGATVTMLCGPNGRAAAELLPGVEEIIEFRAPWIDPDGHAVDADAVGALVEEVRVRRFDQAAILTSFHQSPLPLALLLRLAGVPTVAAVSVDYPGTLLDVRHLVSDDIHEVERNLSLVATLGHRLAPGDDGRLAIALPNRCGPPGDLQPPYVVVHPGASVPARGWSVEGNRAAVAALLAAGWHVAVTGGTSERGLTAAVAAGHEAGVVDLGGRTSFVELAAVLAGADAVVVGNTGAAHLAVAVGTPVVSVYAPTVPASRWRPWHQPHVLLGDQAIACAGCRARTCPVAGHPCVAGVTAAQVLSAVKQLAGRPAAAAVPA